MKLRTATKVIVDFLSCPNLKPCFVLHFNSKDAHTAAFGGEVVLV